MFLAAVTGTNGKTSTVEFTRQILHAAGHRACSYGTLGLIDGERRDESARMGVGEAAAHRFIRSLARKGMEAVAFEAYSHPLRAGLLDCLKPDAAAFTSFSRDHLDIHRDRQAYFAAKRRLFADILPPGKTAVLNADIPEGEKLRAVCDERGISVLTFGRHPQADLRMVDLQPRYRNTEATLSLGGHRFCGELALTGDFMVANILCAAGLSLAAGVEPAEIIDTLPALRSPPGRVEWIGAHRGADIFVDYAHTPAALRAVLCALRKRTDGRLLLLFGCGGNRDRGKRRQMGAVAQKLADLVFITDDNPRDEEPAAIRRQIATFCPRGREVAGRRQALVDSLSLLMPGDTLLVAGKGHERQQTIGHEILAFSDRKAILELMAQE